MGFHQDFARSTTKVMEFTLLLAEEMQGQPSSSLYSTALLVLVLEHVSLHKSYVAEVFLLMVDLCTASEHLNLHDCVGHTVGAQGKIFSRKFGNTTCTGEK